MLSAVDRHFPPAIVGVATWVATFRFAEYPVSGPSQLGLFTVVPDMLDTHTYLVVCSPPMAFFAVFCRRRCTE